MSSSSPFTLSECFPCIFLLPIISYRAHSHSQRPPSFDTDEACPPFSPFGCTLRPDRMKYGCIFHVSGGASRKQTQSLASGRQGVLVHLTLDCFVLDKFMQIHDKQVDEMNLVCFVRLLCVKTDSMHDFTLNK